MFRSGLKPSYQMLNLLGGLWRHHPRYAGCLVHWALVENGGTLLYDLSGDGNNGTLTNMAVGSDWVGAPSGACLDFDGVDDYVVSQRVLNTSVVTMLVRTQLLAYRADATQGAIGGFFQGYGAVQYDKILFATNTGVVNFQVYDGAERVTNSTTVLALNTWADIVGVADGTTAVVYLNGLQVGTVGAAPSYTGYTLPNIFLSGSSWAFGIFRPQNCRVAEFRVWNRPLSPVEAQSLTTMPFLEFAWAWELLHGRVWAPAAEAVTGQPALRRLGGVRYARPAGLAGIGVY